MREGRGVPVVLFCGVSGVGMGFEVLDIDIDIDIDGMSRWVVDRR